MKKAFLLISSLVLIVLLNSCNDKPDRPPKVDPAFSSYISAFTTGVVSSESSILIRLADNFVKEAVAGEQIPEEWITFSPKIKGKLLWADSRTLEFIPDEPLKRKETYNGVLKLDEFMEIPEDLREFAFQFHVMGQHLGFELKSVKPYNNNELKWIYTKGTVISMDVAENENIEEILEVKQDGKKLNITWTHDLNRKLHHFTIDSLERTEVDQEIQLEFNGAKVEADQEENLSIEIPSLGTFKITETRVVQQPEQYVLLRFSDPLLPKQNLDGIIQLGNVNNTTYVIEDNEIKVFPPVRLSGSRNLEIGTGLKNILGYSTKTSINVNIVFEEIKPDVRITESKIILPSTDGLSFPFEAVNLSAVDVKIVRVFEKNAHQFFQINNLNGSREMKRVGRVIRKKTIELNPDGDMDLGRWNTFHLDLNKIIKAEKGAIYRVEISFRKTHSLYSCGDPESSDQEEENLTDINADWDSYEDDNDDHYNNYYYDYYYDDYYYDYYYDYRERENPCDNSYYRYRGAVAKNLFASDLGIITKRGNDNSIMAAVTNLVTADLMPGVEVVLYNYQNVKIASKTTDKNGIVNFDNLKKSPFLLVANKGKEYGYVKFENGSSLSLSKFDVGGSLVQKGIKGFIYGERGVWRPGDTLFLSFVLEDEFKTLPKNHPVQFTLKNPKGLIVERITKTIGKNGFYPFIIPTSTEDLTGNWNATIRVGGATFNKRLKIETIKPNRLKISIDFGKERISVSDKKLDGAMQVNWLHGAPARNLRAKVGVTFKSIHTSFDQFGDYHFDDPVRSFNTDEKVIFDERISEDGSGTIDLNVQLNDRAPGFLRAYFSTKVFEEGGEFSVDRFSIPFAPYESFVGVNMPESDGWWGMLETGKEHAIDLVTVDPDGNPIQRDSLEIKIFKVSHRWWWSRYDDNLSKYEYSTGITPEIQGNINTDENGFAKFDFEIDDALWGRYLIRITDPVSGHATGKMVYFDWPGWRGRSNRKNAEGETMLMFSTDKDTYEVGEMCEISFPSSSGGRALISIENGTHVLSSHWVETKDDQTTYRIKITEEMTPNIYINTTLIQPHSQTANDMPIRMYGIIPVGVENPNSHLYPIIEMPEKLRPEEKFKVKISEQNNQKMTYTLAIVDEGLLDLTNFKTPDPWSHFYAREALGVTTWDIYDNVIGSYGSNIQKLLSIGGDGESTEKGKNKANRFKPVVLYVGPFTLEPGQTKTHEFLMPNYIGSVKTMVVVGNQGAYGKAEKVTPVKKPLMVLATLPRVVGPGEDVILPVTVFAMEKNIKNVSIEVEINDLFTSENGLKKQITFAKPGDQVVNFNLGVVEKLGVGVVNVVVKSGNEVSHHEIEIQVRNPNPEVTNVIQGVVDAGSTWNSTFDLTGIDGTNSAILEISTIPPIDFSRRMKYLIGYPHGCVEQTTSKAFPQLFMPDVIEMSDQLQIEISNNVKAAINKLVGFQTSNGGLSYWPGQYNPNDWGTSYAGHFMLEAEAKGYELPQGFKSGWLNYQKNAALEWRAGERKHEYYWRYSDLVQAYRLYTLALAGEPELGAMNRLKEKTDLTVQSQWRLAAAYQLAGQGDVAQSLIDKLTTEIDEYTTLSYTYGSSWRDQAMIIETLTLMDQREKAAPIVRELAERLSSNYWYSTQTTAYGLMAIAKFAGVTNDEQLRFSFSFNGESAGDQFSQKSIMMEELSVSQIKGNKFVIENKSDNILFTRLILTGKPLSGNDTSSKNDLNLSVTYYDLENNRIDVSKIEQGTDFKAVVSIVNPGYRGFYEEMALTQIFPSGWEILNTRMDEVASIHTSDIPTYQDIRDDRVYTYFNIYRNKSKSYTILLNASYQGRFYLPSVTCEAMYDKTIYAREKGQWVEVVPRGEALSSTK